MSDDRTVIRDETSTSPTGAVRRVVEYSDGSRFEFVTMPTAGTIRVPMGGPLDISNVSAAGIARMEADAATENDRSELESRWDETWGTSAP
jgi:hypothetical protein